MTFTADDQAGLIARLESLQEWDWANKLRELKLPGRSREERVNGFTPRINALTDLHFDIIAAGGDYAAFIADGRVAHIESESDRLAFLFSIWKPRNWRALRECIKQRVRNESDWHDA